MTPRRWRVSCTATAGRRNAYVSHRPRRTARRLPAGPGGRHLQRRGVAGRTRDHGGVAPRACAGDGAAVATAPRRASRARAGPGHPGGDGAAPQRRPGQRGCGSPPRRDGLLPPRARGRPALRARAAPSHLARRPPGYGAGRAGAACGRRTCPNRRARRRAGQPRPPRRRDRPRAQRPLRALCGRPRRAGGGGDDNRPACRGTPAARGTGVARAAPSRRGGVGGSVAHAAGSRRRLLRRTADRGRRGARHRGGCRDGGGRPGRRRQ